MSDIEQNNDPLERLFQDNIQEYDIEFNEDDWQKLESRLDLADAKYAYKRRLRWMAAAALLLFALLGYFTFENYSTLGRLTDKLADNTPTIEQPGGVANSTPQNQHAPDAGTNPAQAEGANNAELPDHSGDASPPVSANSADGTIAGETQQKNSGLEQRKSSAFAVRTEAGNALTISEISCPGCTLSPPEIGQRPISSIPASSSPQTFTSSSASQPFNHTHDAAEAQSIQANKSFPNIALGFVMAPDLSTAGSLTHFDDPGYKIGLSAAFNLTSRFAITTGIIHSNVNYQARGNEYNPPGGYWPGGNAADITFAQCALIDIPLNLKYDFVQFQQSTLFASAGFSSYIMLKEDYRSEYRNGSTDLNRRWSDNTGTRHWFSIANISIGYERNLYDNLSIQVEPFIKLPLKGVGWGDVKLYSVGSFVSLNYNLH